MKFHIGQRVRIVDDGVHTKSAVPFFGKEGVIVRRCDIYPKSWELDITDAVTFHEDHLRPLTNPDESAWNEFKTRHLTPDPEIILAKEPA